MSCDQGTVLSIGKFWCCIKKERHKEGKEDGRVRWCWQRSKVQRGCVCIVTRRGPLTSEQHGGRLADRKTTHWFPDFLSRKPPQLLNREEFHRLWCNTWSCDYKINTTGPNSSWFHLMSFIHWRLNCLYTNSIWAAALFSLWSIKLYLSNSPDEKEMRLFNNSITFFTRLYADTKINSIQLWGNLQSFPIVHAVYDWQLNIFNHFLPFVSTAPRPCEVIAAGITRRVQCSSLFATQMKNLGHVFRQALWGSVSHIQAIFRFCFVIWSKL